jgi:hypothetical protein
VQALLLFVVVGALAVLASQPATLRAHRFVGLAQLAASGLAFLVLGAALGPHGLGALSVQNVGALQPVLSLGLGFAGLLMGLNLDPRLVRGVPGRVFAAVLAEAGGALVVVALPLSLLIYFALGFKWWGALGAAAVLGGAASISSGHQATLWVRAGRLDRARGLGVTLLAMLDDFLGVALLGVALVFGAVEGPLRGMELVAISVVLGLLCGAFLAYLVAAAAEPSELMAVMIGGVALVAGAAAYLKVSALIAGLVCGGTLAVVGGRSVERIYRVLSRVERPVYLVLLVVIGLHADPLNGIALAFVPAFVALRLLGKVMGGRWAAKLTRGWLPMPAEPGLALVAQGGASLCIVTEYLLLVDRPSTHLAFGVAVFAVLVNEVLASRAFPQALRPRGEAAGGAA